MKQKKIQKQLELKQKENRNLCLDEQVKKILDTADTINNINENLNLNLEFLHPLYTEKFGKYRTWESIMLSTDVGLQSRFYDFFDNLESELPVKIMQIALEGFKYGQSSIILEFENFDTFINCWTEDIDKKGYVTEEDLVEVLAAIYKVKASLISVSVFSSKIIIVISIIGFITTIIAEVKNHIPNPQAASIEIIHAFQHELFKSLSLNPHAVRLLKKTTIPSTVYRKPRANAFHLAILPKNCSVLVLNYPRKWAFVIYFNPFTKLYENGWVMKKTLS